MTVDPSQRRVSDLAASLIRTWVPIGAGAVLAWVATSQHIVLPSHASAAVGVAATALCAAGYYALARLLEHAPGQNLPHAAARALGRWMLGGVVKIPTYVSPPAGG